ncbi:hypothetical protein Glove_481g65 [Diversispora epigaea]|uniref:Endonuclease/exonuclease/phosphatase domain-containing protein n=1 Tax=Diversispora epigaea TaxID=1348612 RepID=A0A397GJU0_9GLOM|nr:hypothetical protein Glove_481g65 [Diversispora epigaea]
MAFLQNLQQKLIELYQNFPGEISKVNVQLKPDGYLIRTPEQTISVSTENIKKKDFNPYLLDLFNADLDFDFGLYAETDLKKLLEYSDNINNPNGKRLLAYSLLETRINQLQLNITKKELQVQLTKNSTQNVIRLRTISKRAYRLLKEVDEFPIRLAEKVTPRWLFRLTKKEFEEFIQKCSHMSKLENRDIDNLINSSPIRSQSINITSIVSDPHYNSLDTINTNTINSQLYRPVDNNDILEHNNTGIWKLVTQNLRGISEDLKQQTWWDYCVNENLDIVFITKTKTTTISEKMIFSKQKMNNQTRKVNNERKMYNLWWSSVAEAHNNNLGSGVAMGDWNATPNPSIDRFPEKRKTSAESSLIQSLMYSGYIDIYRILNKDKVKFTFHQIFNNTIRSKSRIDSIWINQTYEDSIMEADIDDMTLVANSDHLCARISIDVKNYCDGLSYKKHKRLNY